MTTVAQVAKASLQKILVQGSEAPFEADEYQDFIFAMNNYMAALEADGIDLGYTAVSTIGDTVTVAAGAINGIVDNMAILVAPDFGGEVTGTLVQSAKNGLNTMRRLGRTITATSYPSTLPKGSGHQDSGISDDIFYDGSTS